MGPLKSLSIICKKIRSKTLLDLFFPPLCLCCKEPLAEKWFCLACWQLLALPDPSQRCRHCFTLAEGPLCSTCRKQPLLCFPRIFLFEFSLPATILWRSRKEIEEALSAMALIFWHRFAYHRPDEIIPLPDEKGEKTVFHLAKRFARLLDAPYSPRLKRNYARFLKPALTLSDCSSLEGKSVLLFDGGSSHSWREKACAALSEGFPKKVLIFSLFEGG